MMAPDCNIYEFPGLSVYRRRVHTSQRVIPVLGSLIAGSRPLGLMSVKDRSLTSENSTNVMTYGIQSSSRTIHTFLCFDFY
jgi:hypothetical protein